MSAADNPQVIRPFVYLSGAMSNGNRNDRETYERNVRAGIEMWHRLQDTGLVSVFCPHLSLYLEDHRKRPYEDWISYDYDVMPRCDANFQMRNGPSRGSDIEEAWFREHEKPVFTDIEELKRWAGRRIVAQGVWVNRPRILIGLRGVAGAGKSTLAKLVVDKWTQTRLGLARIEPFAEPLRLAVRAAGIDRREMPNLFRRAAQVLGEIARTEDPNFLLKQWEYKVKSTHRPGLVVADDVRFPNEVASLDHVFYVVPEGFEPASLGPNANHMTETWNLEALAYLKSYPNDSHGPNGGPMFEVPTTVIRNRVDRAEEAAEQIIDAIVAKELPQCLPRPLTH